MIIEVLRDEHENGWRVTLNRSNFRPERRHVEVDRDGADDYEGDDDDDEAQSAIVGFSDDEEQANVLFETVLRTIRLVSTGECDSVNWTELPEGLYLE